MNALKSNRIRLAVTIAISFAILYILFRRVDIEAVKASLGAVDLGLVILASSISIFANIIVGALKWKRILSLTGCDITFKEALFVRSGCIPFKTILPLKSSELIKAFYLKERRGMPFTRGASSLIMEKALNILIVAVLFLVGIVSSDIMIPLWIPIAALASILVLVFSARARSSLTNIAKSVHPGLSRAISGLLSSFDLIDAKKKVVLSAYSLVYEFSEFLNVYILFRAVGIDVPFSLILVFIPFIMVINNLPITVLGLGTREALIVFLFARYGAQASLLSGGLLVSLVEHILPVLVGVFFIKSLSSYFSAGLETLSETRERD